MMTNGLGQLVKRILPLALVASLMVVSSCRKKEITAPNPPGEVTNDEINRWVTENMRDVYYWNTSIPQDGNLNFNLGPEAFFQTILHPDDRFSWIQLADELEENLSGVSRTVGLGIGLYQVNQAGDVFISVRYALKDSPADKAGIVRGDIITAINGQSMTTSNYNNVLNAYYGSAPFTVQLAKITAGQVVDDQEITLTPVTGFQEQAIHLDSVLVTPTGKQVGYLFYNRFLNNQPNELLAAFNRFKTANVEDLVLDLRYNGGGGIWISAILTGLIYANFDEDEPFIQYKYNSNYRDVTYTYNELFGGDSNDPDDVAAAKQVVDAIKALNLNLTRVFIIATGSSASASELVINNLRPFLSDANVVHIGRTTVGKNEGSFTIVDDRTPRRIEWGIQPIVVKLANKNGFGDYPNGLAPQHDINEWNYLPWAPIGSLEDPLLARALSIIDPSVQAIAAKMMSARAETARGLRVVEVSEFQDKLNKPIPVDIGERFRRNN